MATTPKRIAVLTGGGEPLHEAGGRPTAVRTLAQHDVQDLDVIDGDGSRTRPPQSPTSSGGGGRSTRGPSSCPPSSPLAVNEARPQQRGGFGGGGRGGYR